MLVCALGFALAGTGAGTVAPVFKTALSVVGLLASGLAAIAGRRCIRAGTTVSAVPVPAEEELLALKPLNPELDEELEEGELKPLKAEELFAV